MMHEEQRTISVIFYITGKFIRLDQNQIVKIPCVFNRQLINLNIVSDSRNCLIVPKGPNKKLISFHIDFKIR